MNNFDYPSIGYTIACDVAPFDTLVTSWAIYDVKYNIAESMTVVGKYGCAAFLGNTRSGWVFTSYILEQKFINKLKQNFGKVGVAEALSKADYKSHWLTLTHNLIGCPEFEMWTDIPSQFVNASNMKVGDCISYHGGNVNLKLARIDNVQIEGETRKRYYFYDMDYDPDQIYLFLAKMATGNRLILSFYKLKKGVIKCLFTPFLYTLYSSLRRIISPSACRIPLRILRLPSFER